MIWVSIHHHLFWALPRVGLLPTPKGGPHGSLPDELPAADRSRRPSRRAFQAAPHVRLIREAAQYLCPTPGDEPQWR